MNRKLLSDLVLMRALSEYKEHGDMFATRDEMRRIFDDPLEYGHFIAKEIMRFLGVDDVCDDSVQYAVPTFACVESILEEIEEEQQ